MSFTRALYYPWIEITESSWLKNAVLYWEAISTIVPSSVEDPYKTREAMILADEGLLLPIRVDHDSPEVREVSRQARSFFREPEGLSVVLPSDSRGNSWQARQQLEKAILYPEKLEHEFLNELLQFGHARNLGNRLEVDRGFANYYMTLLATSLSNERGIALVTDEQKYDTLANKVRTGTTEDEEIRFRNHISQGLLAYLVIQSVKIDPDTPINKLLAFRREHQDELGQFRVEVERLSQLFQQEWESITALQQAIEDIHLNNINPAINNLKSSLKSFDIDFILTSLRNTVFGTSISFVPGWIIEPYMGEYSTPIAVLIGAAFSVTVNLINFRRSRAHMLRDNPYTYLLRVERQLS